MGVALIYQRVGADTRSAKPGGLMGGAQENWPARFTLTSFIWSQCCADDSWRVDAQLALICFKKRRLLPKPMRTQVALWG